MRVVLAFVAVVVVAGCGSRDHASRILTGTGQVPEAAGTPRAGGPATLRIENGRVTGKALLVVRVQGANIVVRNPRGGTLTITHRHPAGARAAAVPGDHVSFTGTIGGARVTAGTLAVIG